jgi:hypothetical protein
MMLTYGRIKSTKSTKNAEFRSDVNLKRQTVTLGKNRFQFSSTNFNQITTLLWFEHWCSRSNIIGIAETDKTKFMISSIMEEAWQ